jgi:oligopeptide/dipeptide ABC transporter ATP-binding protein
MTHDSSPVLEVEDLRVELRTSRGVVRAVNGVSFQLHRGETLAVVGESGSGKSMTSRALMRLLPRPAGRITAGSIRLEGEELLTKSEKEMQLVRGRQISMVLQDPTTALNPLYTIGYQLQEPLRYHQRMRGEPRTRRAASILEQMRIPSPRERLSNYPHQLSGGMRQRVAGGIALACTPSVLIADEPTTSLDVTIQAQYLKLLADIQRDTGMALIFVTHDFGVVAQIADRVAVMYAGRIVEYGTVGEIFDRPGHPYTRALVNSITQLEDSIGQRLQTIEGSPPSLERLPSGCPFHPRCPEADAKCQEAYPPNVVLSPGHEAECWRPAND